MCIRSKHGAITACCAIFENVVHSKIYTHSRHSTVHHPLAADLQVVQSKELTSSTSRNSILPCILFCLVLIIHNPIASTAITPALASRREMETDASGFTRNSSTPIPSPFRYPYRSRIKRMVLPRPERHLWTPDLVAFVCEELTDPCQRAAFLRRHAYHEICSDVPPLYLLPHIDHHNDVDDVVGGAQTSAQLCFSKDKGIRSTDGLFRSYLDSPGRCRQSLQSLDTTIRSSISSNLEMFVDILERSFCFPNSTSDTMLEECVQCRKAYWSWVCTTTFPIFFPVAKLPHLNDGAEATTTVSPDTTVAPETASLDASADVTKEAETARTTTARTSASVEQLKKALVAAGGGEKFVLQRVLPCSSWCTQVETLCPYFNPSDATSNGGEPTFLCDESHYQYAPPQSTRMGGHYQSCELDCCFTEQDLLMDVVSLADTYVPAAAAAAAAAAVSAHLPSSLKNSSLRHHSSTSEQQAIDEEGEYLSLTARCLHQQLSESLGAQSGYEPLQHSSQNLASSKSAEPNAFLFSVILLVLNSVAAEVLY